VGLFPQVLSIFNPKAPAPQALKASRNDVELGRKPLNGPLSGRKHGFRRIQGK